MPKVQISSTVRSLLTDDINLSADEVIKKARTKGVTAPEKSIREAVYTIRSELKKAGAKAAPAPAAARETKAPKPAQSEAPSAPAADLGAVLANVALVNAVVGTCGGVDPARQVAEAVRSCGSVDAFLQHLELVAQVRGPSA